MSEQPFSCTHKAQYYETDQMGIIHHSNYIRWFEEARTAYLAWIGYPYKKMEESGVSSPVLEVTCQYKSMVHFEDEVIITPAITFFNGIKLLITYTVIDAQTGDIRTTGTSKHCFLNPKGQPLSLKKSHPEIYQTLLAHLENPDH